MQNKDNNDILNEDITDNNDENFTEESAPLIDDYEEQSFTEEEDFTPEEDYEPEPKAVQELPRKRKKKKRKRRRSRLPGIIILTTFVFALSICLSLVIIAFGRDMLGIGKSDSTHLIVIPNGATTAEISELLKDEGIIKSPECFQLFSRLRKSDSSYIAGEHFVRPNMAYETIINELTTIDEVK
ncbi:MAG: endolytic transglycosylase MltG, partial [Prevotella sp.]|nr:endolytic transglycosylase MltG [Prevotella sp.]